MAGMLPGVECARRRRFHVGGLIDPVPAGSRRSSFCLYRTGVELHPRRNSTQRSILSKEIHDEALGVTAREAKERLDARLRIIRHGNQGELLNAVLGNVQREVFSASKSTAARKFRWRKWWKVAPEQADCAVCLEDFKAGDSLIHLPCDHRFHWNCALPWLESSSHCPCCRMTTFS